jgi:hypothetical protein
MTATTARRLAPRHIPYPGLHQRAAAMLLTAIASVILGAVMTLAVVGATSAPAANGHLPEPAPVPQPSVMPIGLDR